MPAIKGPIHTRMTSSPSSVSSDSHKAAVTWKMKIDKLTLLHDIPEQWKQGMVSAMIYLVTDPSNQSKYGISRSYSTGCRGYSVSIAGKVPVSTDPLIWSKDGGYLFQVEPKKGNTPWLRLDINPLALTASGVGVPDRDARRHLGGALVDLALGEGVAR